MRQRRTVIVERPLDQVRAFLADPTNLPRWIDAVDDVELLEKGPDGSVAFSQRVRENDEGDGFEGVVDTGPSGQIRYAFEGERSTFQAAFSLKEVPAGTRVRQEIELPLTGWSTKVLAPFLWWVNRRRLAAQLDELKRVLERAEG